MTAEATDSNGLRVFANGQTFTLVFTTQTGATDIVNWTITDYQGNTVARNSFTAAPGTQTNTLSCSGTQAGYFAVGASLSKAGGSLPAAGTRPAGIATFGIEPAPSVVPAVNYSYPDQHRFGMQGFNDNGPALSALGISWTIDDREQSWGEPNGPNTYTPNVSDLDPFYAANPQIMRLIRLDGIPAWDSSTGQFNDSYSLPKNLSEYSGYMQKVGTDSASIGAQYYPNQRYNYYQVTWEPSLGWVYPSANFVKLYQTVYGALHLTDNKAMVMGVANSFPNNNDQATGNWLQQYQSSGLCNYLDGVSTHGYYNAPTTPSNPPELQDGADPATAANALDNEMAALRATMQSCKPNMLLWMTELGISYDSGIGYGSTAINANQLYAQAVVAARAHIIILGQGAQMTTFFFGPDFPGSPAGYGSFFDLVDSQGSYSATNLSPKPEGMVFAAMTHVLDGTNTLGPLNNLPLYVYGYAFQQLGGGKVITAMWTHNNAQWPINGAYSQSYSVSYSLQVDAPGTSGKVTVLDVMGNPSTVAYSNGQVPLTLTESPLYVVSTNASIAKSNSTVPVGYTGQ
ncbi:hypothetical protein [Paraburkholderia ginsengiterrae]|uniref:hypothetical protein n=1 Tax=Paraburkholderia ginsengiterrae TaxID=1462993 RepID=UPI000A453ABC